MPREADPVSHPTVATWTGNGEPSSDS
jgi:hypothetical protein